jgi:hypothetical protein
MTNSVVMVVIDALICIKIFINLLIDKNKIMDCEILVQHRNDNEDREVQHRNDNEDREVQHRNDNEDNVIREVQEQNSDLSNNYKLTACIQCNNMVWFNRNNTVYLCENCPPYDPFRLWEWKYNCWQLYKWHPPCWGGCGKIKKQLTSNRNYCCRDCWPEVIYHNASQEEKEKYEKKRQKARENRKKRKNKEIDEKLR